MCHIIIVFFFFFNDTATTEIYTLSLHDALPIYPRPHRGRGSRVGHPGLQRVEQLREPALGHHPVDRRVEARSHDADLQRSEEHTSELQSQSNLVCRLLLEKKKIRHTAQSLQPLP